MSNRDAPTATSTNQPKQLVGLPLALCPRSLAAFAGTRVGRRMGPAQVLAVTDHPALAELIQETLSHGRFAVELAANAAAAAAALARELPHLVLLDLDAEELGDVGVLERMRYLRSQLAYPPLITLTRRRDLKTRLEAFALGVDDLLAVPFAPEELRARCLAVLRRLYRDAEALAPPVRVGELEIDVAHRRAWLGTAEFHLTPMELHLLYLLAANAGRVLTREEILDHLWGADYFADSNVVDRHIRNLRTKLHDDWHHPRFVATIAGLGYRFLPARPSEAGSLRTAA